MEQFWTSRMISGGFAAGFSKPDLKKLEYALSATAANDPFVVPDSLALAVMEACFHELDHASNNIALSLGNRVAGAAKCARSYTAKGRDDLPA